MAQPWIIEQPYGARRSVQLSGYAAPFGRPRRGTVAPEEIKVRTNVRRYGGSDRISRQTFGTQNEPVLLHGYWEDKNMGGPGAARAKWQSVKQIARDQQNVIVRWGDTIAFLGFIDRALMRWESENGGPWEIEISYDEDQTTLALEPDPPKPPRDYTATFRRVFDLAKDITTPSRSGLPEKDPKLRLGFVDALSVLVSAILQPVAELEAIANDLKSFKDGTLGQIRKFRAGLDMLNRTLRTFRSVLEEANPAESLETQSADNQIAMAARQAELSAAIAMAFADIAEADRAARQGVIFQIRDIFKALDGDTWERISQRFYGDTSRAQQLAEANDVGTEPPVAGETYIALI